MIALSLEPLSMQQDETSGEALRMQPAASFRSPQLFADLIDCNTDEPLTLSLHLSMRPTLRDPMSSTMRTRLWEIGVCFSCIN